MKWQLFIYYTITAWTLFYINKIKFIPRDKQNINNDKIDKKLDWIKVKRAKDLID